MVAVISIAADTAVIAVIEITVNYIILFDTDIGITAIAIILVFHQSYSKNRRRNSYYCKHDMILTLIIMRKR